MKQKGLVLIIASVLVAVAVVVKKCKKVAPVTDDFLNDEISDDALDLEDGKICKCCKNHCKA